MKKNVKILDFEDKKTQAGKRYVRFKTSDGWISCFDSTTFNALKEFEGKTASVEIVDSGDFKNLKKCYGPAEDEDVNEVEVEKIPSKPKNNTATMYTSYAKDIFIGLLADGKIERQEANTVMEEAISLVKQAKEAFE